MCTGHRDAGTSSRSSRWNNEARQTPIFVPHRTVCHQYVIRWIVCWLTTSLVLLTYYNLHSNGYFAGEPWLFPSTCAGRERFGIKVFAGWKSFCHQTNSVKAVKETQTIDPTSGLASSFLHTAPDSWWGIAPFMPALWHQYVNCKLALIFVSWRQNHRNATNGICCQVAFWKHSLTDCCCAGLVAKCSILRANKRQNSSIAYVVFWWFWTSQLAISMIFMTPVLDDLHHCLLTFSS